MINQQRVDALPEFTKVPDYLYHYADTSPETTALTLGETRISYRGLNSLVNQYAKALLASGIQKGDRIGTLCTPHPDYFILFLACSSIGAVWRGLNPGHQIFE